MFVKKRLYVWLAVGTSRESIDCLAGVAVAECKSSVSTYARSLFDEAFPDEDCTISIKMCSDDVIAAIKGALS